MPCGFEKGERSGMPGPRSILITGGSGFIGENLTDRFLREHHRVFLVTRGQKPRAAAEGFFSVDLGVRDLFSRALGDLHVDAVVHTAAVVSPDECQRDPVRAHAVNVEGTREVAEWAEARRARMIYFSTDLVYGGDRSFYREEDPPTPTNIYGQTKLAGEDEVRRICSDWAVLRLALSYGPTRGTRGDWTWKMREALGQGRNLALYTDQFRTPAYAGDTAEAVLRLARGEGRGLYHMGGRERVSRYAFGLEFARVYGIPNERIVPVCMADQPMGAPRAADCSLDTEKISRELGLSLCSVREGLERQRREET
jgi:dTDP-4-dehydrorhamnose reductase